MTSKKSTAQHRLQGTYRADRHGSDEVPAGRPVPSRELSGDAQRHFDALVDLLLPQNLCSECDGVMLTIFAETLELYDRVCRVRLDAP